MKKLLLLLLIPGFAYSQLNFGAKTGLAIVDNKDDNGVEILNLDEAIYFSGFIEYKGLDFSSEFEILYYGTDGTAYVSPGVNSYSKVNALIPSLSFKYYPEDRFNIKAGFYINSTNLDYTMTGSGINVDENINIEDFGGLLGMEAKLYKGLFLDGRFLFDFNKSDDIKTKHILFGIGYKL